MKAYIWLGFIYVFLGAEPGQSQSISACLQMKTETATQCKSAEPCAILLSKYLLETPMRENDPQAVQATFSLLAFMNCEAYHFSMNDKTMHTCNVGQYNLAAVYMSGLCLSVLIDKSKSPKKRALDYLVKYIEKKSNGVKMTPEITAFLKAYKSGKTDLYTR